jgi:hypothetical protein
MAQEGIVPYSDRISAMLMAVTAVHSDIIRSEETGICITERVFPLLNWLDWIRQIPML